MRKETDSIMLECILSDKEKLDYSKTLSEKVSQKQELEDNFKSMQTQMKAEIVACEGTIRSLAGKINTGREYRLVKCEIKYDFKKQKKSWVRTDTGEIVKETEISAEETQEEMEVKVHE